MEFAGAGLGTEFFVNGPTLFAERGQLIADRGIERHGGIHELLPQPLLLGFLVALLLLLEILLALFKAVVLPLHH